MSIVSVEHADGIAVVTVDNPPVNALSQALRQGLWETAADLDADPLVRAVVLICAGRTFIAGADVTEFGKPPVPPHLPDLVDRLEGAGKPWVAAIHGSALGGGFEIAMGCRFRVALDSALVGLPEVNLGIVPGASGTVRTPRLAGVAAAVDLVTSGRPVVAPRALEMGLVDAVVAGDLKAEAVAFARMALSRPLPPPVSVRPVASPDPVWWEAQRKVIARERPGEIAPLAALDCLRGAAEKPFVEALAKERATFLRLRGSPQAAALRHIFFAERAAPRPAILAGVQPGRVSAVAVIGAGRAAAELAEALRAAGMAVHAVSDGEAALEQAAQERALVEADLVILGEESEPSAGLARLGRICRQDVVLATTSSVTGVLPPDLIRPERCFGLCFLRRPGGAGVLEVASLEGTSTETIATGFALAKRLGSIAVLSGSPGFIGTRLGQSFRAVADELAAEGVSAAGVDAALRDYGFRWNPLDAGADPDAGGRALDQIATSAEITRRVVDAMTEEGRALLAAGVAAKASDVDLVAVHGLGFPRWRGGPMFASGIV